MWDNVCKDIQNEIGLTFENDGEFYMNFNRDFLNYFGEVEDQILKKLDNKSVCLSLWIKDT